MDLKEAMAQFVREELGDCVGRIEFVGPYEGEEFNILITLRDEPEDFDDREGRLRDRVRSLGFDIGIFIDYPEPVVAV